MEARSEGVEILGGDLSDVSLPSLLQLMQYDALSGWLRVARRGEVVVRDGHVLGARCGTLAGADALRELMFHRGGRFSMVRGEPSGERVIENVMLVVLDAYRLRDEWARIAASALRVPPGRPWRPTGGALDALIERFDGRRTAADVVATAPGSAGLSSLVAAVVEAVSAGLLTRRGGPVEPQQEGPELGFHECLERGRSMMRDGNYEAAEQMLRRAEELRPDDRVVQQNLRALASRRRAR